MVSHLRDAFEHHRWATAELIGFCRALDPEQLAATTVGAYGSVFETLEHVVSSDRGYISALTLEPSARPAPATYASFDEMEASAGRNADAWHELLTEALDPERVISLDLGAYEAHAGILVASALYHGTAHREQVCAILTSLGVEPPDLQVWSYADASGRGRAT